MQYSPRIRGDGPIVFELPIRSTGFSPYSRGWSQLLWQCCQWVEILPVFAGMVPSGMVSPRTSAHSPRIRGDGPDLWCPIDTRPTILPVFAGMVPSPANVRASTSHSPRIRGDGPVTVSLGDPRIRFSPYSRGWSPSSEAPGSCCTILPVFAGMVRFPRDYAAANCNSPRIRGDGPPGHKHSAGVVLFSPYSRGWSAPGFPKPSSNRILPVFAGMVRLGA